MNNVETILTYLDQKLEASVELTLYGRAALFLGFEHPPEEYAMSQDIDAVLWKGQAEMLLETTNFWEAVNDVNELLVDQELYISHFFVYFKPIFSRSIAPGLECTPTPHSFLIPIGQHWNACQVAPGELVHTHGCWNEKNLVHLTGAH